MKKIYMTFGVMALFMLVFASAGLVNYLSNSTTEEVTVTSPLTLETETVTIPGIFGGEFWVIDASVINHINDTVNGVLKSIVSNNLGNAGCGDFESIIVTILDGSDAGTYDLSAIGGTCNNNNGKAIIKMDTLYKAYETQSYIIGLKFKQNVEPANYVVTSQIKVANG